MKKICLLSVFVMFLSFSAFAQAGSGYLSILPGYQFSSGDVDDSFVMSLDGGYFFNDNWGLHLGLIYDEGKFDFGKVLLPTVPPTWWEVKYKDSFYVFEIGPELAGEVGKGQMYWQIINLGHTMGLDENEWTYGTAVGYRYPINDKWGFNVQGGYHRVDDYDTDHWDLRLGFTYKF